jgi:hypothetical protein
VWCGTSSSAAAGPGHISLAIVQHELNEMTIEETLNHVIHGEMQAGKEVSTLGTYNAMPAWQKNHNRNNAITASLYFSFFSNISSICGGNGDVFNMLSIDVEDMGRLPTAIKYQSISQEIYNAIKQTINRLSNRPGNWNIRRNCATLVRELIEVSIRPDQNRPRDSVIHDPSSCLEQITGCIDTPNSIFERLQGNMIQFTGQGNVVSPIPGMDA